MELPDPGLDEPRDLLAEQPATMPLVSPAVPLFMNKRATGAPASFCYLYYPWARDVGAP